MCARCVPHLTVLADECELSAQETMTTLRQIMETGPSEEMMPLYGLSAQVANLELNQSVIIGALASIMAMLAVADLEGTPITCLDDALDVVLEDRRLDGLNRADALAFVSDVLAHLKKLQEQREAT